jgi:hypothetical protein
MKELIVTADNAGRRPPADAVEKYRMKTKPDHDISELVWSRHKCRDRGK